MSDQLANKKERNEDISKFLTRKGYGKYIQDHYFLGPSLPEWFVNINKKKLLQRKTAANDKFMIVLVRRQKDEIEAFYAIPYEYVKDILIDDYLNTHHVPLWKVTIVDGQFKVASGGSHSDLAKRKSDVRDYYFDDPKNFDEILRNPQEVYELRRLRFEEKDSIQKTLIESEVEKAQYKEGRRFEILTNRYQRNASVRRDCIQRFGAVCRVCGFDFEEYFGALAFSRKNEKFIHVHHLEQLANTETEHEVRPEDLLPVCPNCHAMLHQTEPPTTPEFAREILKKNGKRFFGE